MSLIPPSHAFLPVSYCVYGAHLDSLLDHGFADLYVLAVVRFGLKGFTNPRYKYLAMSNYPQIKKITNRKLRALVEEFTKSNEHYSLSDNADGECYIVSTAFVKKAMLHLGPRKDMGVIAVGKMKPYNKYSCDSAEGHYVIRVGRLRIDFTARQFSERLPFPRVWLVSQREDSWVRDKGMGVGTANGVRYFTA